MSALNINEHDYVIYKEDCVYLIHKEAVLIVDGDIATPTLIISNLPICQFQVDADGIESR